MESLKEFGEDFFGVWFNGFIFMVIIEDEDLVFKIVEGEDIDVKKFEINYIIG